MRHIKNPVVKFILYAILILWSISVIYPLVWTVLDSVKDNQQFFFNAPWALPDFPLLWSNFSYVWSKYNFSTYFMNSLIITVGSTFLGVLLSAMTAYVLARYKFRGSNVLFLLYISSMMVPFVLALIPLFFLMNSMGLINTKIGLIFVYTSSLLAFGIFILVGFFKSLPKELEEAAIVDGASYYGTFFKVMLPLSQPGLITLGIINVLNIWNEYIVGTILINDPAQYTLPVEIGIMQAEMQYRTEWGPLFAALLITIVPILIVYIIFQRQIASGITAGAVK
ncbi:carbohydrate ABC transporter permease [Paenibacillus macquariensis]|uniref:N-acetylglucosamine transport system permease protein n=1 Tax=Paenibacillus macquariensis TaxID=948756 RepID=A0ABY1K5U5_9BACL|nr:carbohydrate ABC transporter permease [Paenibacillus macquariensis]MEC0090507.1 carbohydrate ABC transporter permease [Paenibacillus macquariensis]OAB38508.1 sugar ABC transporter permease [Paenibacillus macquariensis subsp. macquariensis]SIR30342.1 N-acetylglucosamine transport system permease protein [Paenibacillus macquariensis]